MLMGDWLDTWLKLYVDPMGLADSTKACYHRAVDAIPPQLASRDLQTISAIDLQAWLVFVAKEHPRAAQLDRVMLCKALRTAQKVGLCPGLILDTDTLPKTPHSPKQAPVLTMQQAGVYLKEARTSTHYPLLALCLCGLRRGEALGARWTDLQDGCLHVQRQRLRVARKYQVVQLKTAHSNRVLRLPGQLMHELDAWPRSMRGWILDTTPEKLQHAHHDVLAAAQLPPVTLHGLRHTFATAAAAQGISIKLLQMSLGHAQMRITSDLYADHLSPLSELPALVWQGFAM